MRPWTFVIAFSALSGTARGDLSTTAVEQRVSQTIRQACELLLSEHDAKTRAIQLGTITAAKPDLGQVEFVPRDEAFESATASDTARYIEFRLRSNVAFTIRKAEAIWGRASVNHDWNHVRPPQFDGVVDPKTLRPPPPETTHLDLPYQRIIGNRYCHIGLEVPGKETGDLRRRPVRVVSVSVSGP
jgi:hypothetical protein